MLRLSAPLLDVNLVQGAGAESVLSLAISVDNSTDNNLDTSKWFL